jgi:F0F1-type ATP synthase assembly protein I
VAKTLAMFRAHLNVKEKAGHELGLAKACTRFSHSLECRKFVEEIIQQLVERKSFKEAVKLIPGSKEGIQIGYLINKLVQTKEWGQGVSIILEFAKHNPAVDIRNEVQAFCGSLMKSEEAYRGFELLSVNDQLDIKGILDRAFENQAEDHLHRIYLLAKSWIVKRDKKYDEHLKFIIGKLYSGGDSYYSYYFDDISSNDMKKEMAKVLVTKWMQSINSTSITSSDLVYSWALGQKPNSKRDQYSNAITKENWESKLSRVVA